MDAAHEMLVSVNNKFLWVKLGDSCNSFFVFFQLKNGKCNTFAKINDPTNFSQLKTMHMNLCFVVRRYSGDVNDLRKYCLRYTLSRRTHVHAHTTLCTLISLVYSKYAVVLVSLLLLGFYTLLLSFLLL